MNYSCRPIVRGKVAGELLVSTDRVCFYLADPDTGKVIEEGHALQGRSVAGKILVLPGGKGSSVVQADGLYQLVMKGNAPKGLIVKHLDPVLVTSAVIMDIPTVTDAEESFYRTAEDGRQVVLDAERGVIVVDGDA